MHCITRHVRGSDPFDVLLQVAAQDLEGRTRSQGCCRLATGVSIGTGGELEGHRSGSIVVVRLSSSAK